MFFLGLAEKIIRPGDISGFILIKSFSNKSAKSMLKDLLSAIYSQWLKIFIIYKTTSF